MGSVTLTEITQDLRDALASDQALNDWCLAELGELPTIFVGIDERNKPGLQDCPLIIIRPETIAGGQEQAAIEPVLYVDWGLVNDEITTADRIREYQGVYQSDRMGNLIWNALRSAGPDYALSQSDYTLESVRFFPMHVGGMDIKISIPTTL